jgi:hypothetical protein
VKRAVGVDSDEVEPNDRWCIFVGSGPGDLSPGTGDSVLGSTQLGEHGDVRPVLLSIEDEHPEFQGVFPAEPLTGRVNRFGNGTDKRKLVALLEAQGRGPGTSGRGEDQGECEKACGHV